MWSSSARSQELHRPVCRFLAWKAIFGACLIEVRVVDVDPPLPVRFLRHDYVRHPFWQLRFFDEVNNKQFLDFFVDGEVPFGI